MSVATLGRWSRAALLLTGLFFGFGVGPAYGAELMTPDAIMVGAESSFSERLAAREVRRYLYVRTGRLLPLLRVGEVVPRQGNPIVVGRKDRSWVRNTLGSGELVGRLKALAPEAYWLKTVPHGEGLALLAVGGGDCGTLYAAYRLAEQTGVRFYLHGDVIPDQRMRLRLSALDEEHAPLFRLRGIQPFHDFPEGPDWWNLDDYLAIIGQLPKLGMNFLGLHTYPEGGPNAEPTVWIGVPEQIKEDGRVGFSYPASYQNTMRGNWGYRPKPTGHFSYGAAQFFERDDFGGEVMWGHMPEPSQPEACNDVFDRTAGLLGEAFRWARSLGVRTCVGTETPLTVPERLKEWLWHEGSSGAGTDGGAGDESDRPGLKEWMESELDATTEQALMERLYEGMFRRAAVAYAPDYYWFWTPETWTWEGTKEAQVKRTLADLKAAIAAHQRIQPGFELATCGWVLGPQQDRSLFDKALPKAVAVSCINREVGKTPVDRGFAEVEGRGKWAIPWLEDDPALTSPQLWAGRMRRDAADALSYGCDGLMGIHWRTRVLGPAVRALALAAWDQSGWSEGWRSVEDRVGVTGAMGGRTAEFLDHAIAGTEDDPLYQTVRYDLAGYRLDLPDGRYRLTLRFCEPAHKETGKRVFDVKVQGQTVIRDLDIFARVGPDCALDLSFEDVEVAGNGLEVGFVPRTEFPCVAAIVAECGGLARKINCGGEAYRDYEADHHSEPTGAAFPAVADFYEDWAVHEFGSRVGVMAGEIFARMDGRLPRESDWVQGPGGIRPDARTWPEVAPEYAFVDDLAGLESSVKGAGAKARFDYWLETFRYARAMARLNCTWAEYTNAVGRARAGSDAVMRKELAREEALPLRRRLVSELGEVYVHLLSTVSNSGELGTVANWEQHNLPDLLGKPGEELAEILGEPLPDDAQPPAAYAGPTRLIVPTVRTSLRRDEMFRLKAIIPGETAPREALLHWRRLGTGRYRTVELRRVARAVYQAEVPAAVLGGMDFEYYLTVEPTRGKALKFPVTAPRLNQTVVVVGSVAGGEGG